MRAAAVSTLAKFAVKVPSLRPSILVLLRRSLQVSSCMRPTPLFPSDHMQTCMHAYMRHHTTTLSPIFTRPPSKKDEDDEVRDRVTLALSVLEAEAEGKEMHQFVW